MIPTIHHIDLGLQIVARGESQVRCHITHSYADFNGERVEAYSESPLTNEAAIRVAIANHCDEIAKEMRSVNLLRGAAK